MSRASEKDLCRSLDETLDALLARCEDNLAELQPREKLDTPPASDDSADEHCEDDEASDEETRLPFPVAQQSRQIAFRTDQPVDADALMNLNNAYRIEAQFKEDFQELVLEMLLNPDTKQPEADGVFAGTAPALARIGAIFTIDDWQILGRGFNDYITNRADELGRDSGLVGWSVTSPFVDLGEHAQDVLDDVYRRVKRFRFEKEDEPNELEFAMLSRALRVPEDRISDFFANKSKHWKNVNQSLKCIFFKIRLLRLRDEGRLEEYVQALEEEELSRQAEDVMNEDWY